MEPVTTPRNCPFDYAEALEFDPLLRQLQSEEPVARIRLPHGDGEAWLVTGYDDVRTVTTDRRFSRSAIIGKDFPRIACGACKLIEIESQTMLVFLLKVLLIR